MQSKRDLLSIIVPVFNEESNLQELRARLKASIPDFGFERVEILLINDGSTDRSEQMIAEIVEGDSRFKGVFLTRNFGHQAAVSVGLAETRGDVIAIIDGDLQDPPEAIGLLLKAIADGADVAYGVRTKRKERLFKRVAYHGFYRLLRGVSSIDIPLDTGDFCCMTREVADAIQQLPERNRFLRGLRAWVGFRQVGVEYERAARFAGTPKYTFRKLMALAYDGLFSFTFLPVRLLQVIGLAFSSLAVLAAVACFSWWLLSLERFPSGFAMLIISIWFLSGVQLLFLGLIGEYVTRAYDETRRRPVALVRRIVMNSNAEAAAEELIYPIPRTARKAG